MNRLAQKNTWVWILIGAAAILTLAGLRQAVNPAMINHFFQNMILSHEAQREKAYDGFYRDMVKIRSEIPQGSVLMMSRKGMESDPWNASFCAYFLFPHLVMTDNLQAPARLTGAVYRLSAPPSGDKRPSETYLHSRPYELRRIRPAGAEPVFVWSDFSDLKLTVKSALEVLAKWALLILLGGFLIAGESFRFDSGTFADCFLLGTVLFGMTALFLGGAGFPVLKGFHLLIMFLLAGAGWLCYFRAEKIRRNSGDFQIFSATRWGLIPLLILAVLFLKSMRTPFLNWDDIAIWGIKAKLLFATHDLASLGLAGDWKQYPPLVPLLTAYLAGAGELSAKLVVPCFSAALVIIIRRELVRHVPLFLADMLSGLWLLIPLIFYHSWNLSSNLVLTVFLTQAILILSGMEKPKDFRVCAAAAMAGSGMVLCRPEGIVHWLFILLAFAVSGKWKSGGKFSLILLLPAGVYLAWLAYVAVVCGLKPFSMLKFSGYEHLPFVEPVAVQSVRIFAKWLDLRTFAAVPAAFLLCIFLRWNFLWKRYNFECLYAGFAVLGLVLFSFRVIPIWGTDFYLETGFPRYAMALFPIFFILTVRTAAREILTTAPQPELRSVP